MSDQGEGRRRLRVLSAVVVVALMVAVVWLIAVGGNDSPPKLLTEQQASSESSRPIRANNANNRQQFVPPEPEDTASDEPSRIEEVAERVQSDDGSALAIRFVDDEGEPLPGFAFEWQTFDSGGLRRVVHNDGLDFPGTWNSAKADTAGRAIVDSDAHLIVRSKDESWNHVGGGLLHPHLRGLDLLRYDYIRAFAGGEVESRWGLNVEVDVWVRYEDGMAFQERVEWMPLGANKKGPPSPQWTVVEECPQPLRIRGPRSMWFRVNAVSSRKGYQLSTTLDVNLLGGQQRDVELVIPVSVLPEPSYVEVDCTGLPADADLDDLKLNIFNDRGSSMGRQSIPKSRIVRFAPMIGVRDELCVHMSGSYAWRSEIFQLEPGETKRLIAVPRPGGSAKARILNRDGHPICPAVMFLAKPQHRHTWVAPRWGRGQSFDGVRAHTNDNGELNLKDAPPGTWPMRVEAQGYETLELEVVISSNGERELGDVILDRAQGSITITLKIAEDDEREFVYDLSYVGYGAYTSGLGFFDDENKTTLTAIPKGEYYLYVADKPEHISEGYSGWGKIVKVDGGNVTVEVDTTLPKGNQ